MTVKLTRTIGAALLLVSLCAPAAAAPWPGRVQDILNTFAVLHPTWVADETGDPTPRFQLNQLFAEQVCFELGPAWGMKRAAPGRPVSSDVLARRDGAGLVGWDWEIQHNGTVEQFPPSMDLAGQVFEPVVCRDHFGAPNPPPPGPPPTPPVDFSAVLARLDYLIAQNERLRVEDSAQQERIYLDEAKRLSALSAQVQAHDDKPGAMEQTFGNRYVQIALAVLTALVTQQQVTK